MYSKENRKYSVLAEGNGGVPLPVNIKFSDKPAEGSETTDDQSLHDDTDVFDFKDQGALARMLVLHFVLEQSGENMLVRKDDPIFVAHAKRATILCCHIDGLLHKANLKEAEELHELLNASLHLMVHIKKLCRLFDAEWSTPLVVSFDDDMVRLNAFDVKNAFEAGFSDCARPTFMKIILQCGKHLLNQVEKARLENQQT